MTKLDLAVELGRWSCLQSRKLEFIKRRLNEVGEVCPFHRLVPGRFDKEVRFRRVKREMLGTHSVLRHPLLMLLLLLNS